MLHLLLRTPSLKGLNFVGAYSSDNSVRRHKSSQKSWKNKEKAALFQLDTVTFRGRRLKKQTTDCRILGRRA